jgi:hypothetical protein
VRRSKRSRIRLRSGGWLASLHVGSNALFAYVLHDLVGDSVKKFVPRDAPPVVMWLSFAVFFFICWLFVRSLEKKNIYIKL